MQALVPVYSQRHPFAPACVSFHPVDTSLADIIKASDLPVRFKKHGTILINDQVVPRKMWARVRPKAGARIAIQIVPHGNDVFRTVAMIAILAGSVLISGGILGPIGAALGFGGVLGSGIGASIAAVTFSVGASLALNALSPPPSTSSISPANTGTQNSASLQGNVMQPGGTLPHVRGTRKIFPPFVVKPLVEVVGEDEIVTAVYGLSGPHALSDLRVAGAPFASIEGLTYETRAGHASDTALTLVTRQSTTIGGAFKLSKYIVPTDSASSRAIKTPTADNCPVWHSVGALGSPDEVWLTLRWQALVDSATPTTDIIMPVRVRIRQIGTTSWKYLPEIFFRSHRAYPLTRDIRLMFETAPALPTPSIGDAPYAAVSVAPMCVRSVSSGQIGNAANLANIFDGATSFSSTGGVTSIYFGGKFTLDPRIVTKAILASPGGFSNSATWKAELRGKNGSAPASGTDGTLLATTGFIANTTSPVTLTSSDISTQWDYIFVTMTGSASGILQLENCFFFDDGEFSWLADSYFYSGFVNRFMDATNIASTQVRRIGLYSDRAEVYLDTGTYPKGDYEIQIKRGAIDAVANFTIANYVTNDQLTVYADFFKGHMFASGNSFTPYAVDSVADDVECVRVASVWNTHPLTNAPGDIALIAVKAKNKQLGQISCLASRYVYDYNSTLGTWTNLTTTNNPAAHSRDVLTGGLNADPVPDDLLDDASFIAFRSRCAAYGYQVNAVFDNQSADVVAQVCTSSGYARMRQSELFAIIQDKDHSAESPVQTFSARNSRGYTWERDFPRLPSGFRCIYADSTNNYLDTELIVNDPAGDGLGRLEQMQYDGYVTTAEVQARALFDLAQIRARAVRHSFETNQQAIKCRRGDLIALNHPILESQMGAGYVRSIALSGSDVLSLTLDGTVPGSASRLGAQIRLETGDEIVAECTIAAAGSESTTVTFVVPLAGPVTGLDIGCLVTTGLLGAERLRLVVGEILPKEGAQFPCTIMALDEAPEIFGNATARNIIRQLGLDEDLVLCLDAGDGDSFATGQVWYDTSGQGNDFWFGNDAN